MKIRKQPDLARLITDLDKKKDGTGNQLSFTHGTSISWKMIKGHKQGLRRRHLIKYVIDNMPVLNVAPVDGIERKSKFTHNQLQRVNSVLDEILKWYWFPFSKVRRDLNRLCK